MKKIIVDKSEGIAEVIEKIISEEDKDITLVIPRGSVLGESLSNFHLLRREAHSAEKTVSIESVDDTILAFAKESSIPADHPLWKSGGTASVSDIVPRERGTASEEKPAKGRRGKKKTDGVHLSIKHEEPRAEEPEESEEAEEYEPEVEKPEKVVSRKEMDRDMDEEEGERRSSKKFLVVLGVILAVVVVAVYLLSTVFAHADITIDFQKTPWAYQGNFVADKNATQVTTTNTVTTIPAQVFSSNKNVTGTFHASGSGNVSQKAQGVITIYNNYSSASQELVATTRFLTPDGKLFRLVSDVVVPGAEVASGTMTPSSITAPIIADQAGPSYNVGPVARLSIPGFQGTAKENGFYGSITGQTTGGFVGPRATPTVADINSAKASTTALLQAALQSGFTGNYPNNFKILDGATSIQIGKLIVNTSTDDNGNFTVFGQATLQAIGFDENGSSATALKNYLLSLAQVQTPSSTFNSLNLNYASVKADFTKGQASFALSGQGSLAPAFSSDDFRSMILGQSMSTVRSDIQALPSLTNGQMSVWPFWLWKIPGDPNKVHITVQ